MGCARIRPVRTKTIEYASRFLVCILGKACRQPGRAVPRLRFTLQTPFRESGRGTASLLVKAPLIVAALVHSPSAGTLRRSAPL